MNSPAPLRLPKSVTGQQPTGRPDDLRTMRPLIGAVVPAPGVRAETHAVGTHTIRLNPGLETRATTIDGTAVLFAGTADGATMHVLCDTARGVVQVDGFTSEQLDTIRSTYFDGATVPTSARELSTVLDRVAARNPGRVDIDPTAKDPDTKRALRLLGLSASTDPIIDNTYAATRGITAPAREVDRLVALAAALDDGASSGDSEVDRLARMADNLSDG